jgi:hypothetical protein
LFPRLERARTALAKQTLPTPFDAAALLFALEPLAKTKDAREALVHLLCEQSLVEGAQTILERQLFHSLFGTCARLLSPLLSPAWVVRAWACGSKPQARKESSERLLNEARQYFKQYSYTANLAWVVRFLFPETEAAREPESYGSHAEDLLVVRGALLKHR